MSIETEKMDDIALLLTHIQYVRLIELLDKYISIHGLAGPYSLALLIQSMVATRVAQATMQERLPKA